MSYVDEQIGCRRCGKGNNWRIFYDKKEFTAQCADCKHIIAIKGTNLVKKKDESPCDMRFFV